MGKKQRRLKEAKKNEALKSKQAYSQQIKSDRNNIPLWQWLIPPFILSTIAAIFYAPSTNYAFQFDDIANIKKHFHIRHHTLSELFFSSTRWISFWLNSIHYSIGKFNPFSYRVGNVIIHIISGLMVFFILMTALKHLKKKNFFSENAFPIAFLSSIIFLLHPVQTQTISYVIQGQLEGLASMFILSMIFCFLKRCYAQTTFARYFFTVLLFCLAAISCGTKEIAIISPALLLIIDWFFVAQGNWQSLKKRLYIHIPIALIVFSCYIYFLKPTFFTEILGLQRLAKNNIGNIITENPTSKITPWMFFRSQFKVILHYLWMFIWPFNISVEYDWVLSRSFFAPDCIFPFLGLIAIGIFICKLLFKDKAHIVAFGLVWFLVAIAPRSSIIPSPELLVDYKTYTASFGWIFLLATGILFAFDLIHRSLLRVYKSWRPPKLARAKKDQYSQHCKTIFSLILAMPLGFLTINRNTVWRSGTEFWGNIIKNAPGKARAYNNYGVELSQNNRDYQSSISYFKKAISMDKQYPDPWNNLAVAYANLGQIDNAIISLKQSLKIYAYHPEGYNNLASFYIQKKELVEANRLLDIALQLRPHYGKAYFNKGRIHFAKKETEKAWVCFKKACTECDFDNVPYGFATYGKVSMLLKKYDDAIFAYQKALSFDPNYPGAAFNLANAYYMKKNYSMAETIYKKTVAQNPGDLKTWYNLGETYLAQQKHTNALKCYKRAENMKKQLPILSVRIANCLEKIGKTNEAKKTLLDFIKIDNKNNNQLAQMQMKARVMLGQLNQKYTTV